MTSGVMHGPGQGGQRQALLLVWGFRVYTEGAQPGNFGVLLDLDGSHRGPQPIRNQGPFRKVSGPTLPALGTNHHPALPERRTPGRNGDFHRPNPCVGCVSGDRRELAPQLHAFKGAIDEVRLYNYTLPAEDIRGSTLRPASGSPRSFARAWTCAWSGLACRKVLCRSNQPTERGRRLYRTFGDLSLPSWSRKGPGFTPPTSSTGRSAGKPCAVLPDQATAVITRLPRQ